MIFAYHVTFWDELNETEANENGIVSGKDYGEAANKIAAFYKYNVFSIELAMYEEVMTQEELVDVWD